MSYRTVLSVIPALVISIVGCGSSSAPSGAAPTTSPTDTKPPIRAAELGTGDRSPDSVALTEVAGEAAGLKTPRDLAFNPLRPDELWVLNLGDESTVIIHDASTEGRTAERRKDGYALHFMAKPSAIDFGAADTTIGLPGTFATTGESRNTYDDTKAANDFMGPALWSSDLSIFAKENPNGLGSHLDMLHNSPLGMGIAHQEANIYWVFSGLSNSLVKYDFKRDNGVGNDDHSDGESYQYATGQVKYSQGVPSHLFFHASDAMLYVADTGNSRVARLDTTAGTKGKTLPSKEPMAVHVQMNGTSLVDIVSAGSGLLQQPSGIEMRNEFIYVSDNATSRITAFTLAGEQVNYLDTGLPSGSLAGMNFGPDGKLYLVDMIGHRVLRIDPK